MGPKISIIGCGNVGMRFAYAAVIQNIARTIVLLDIDKDKAQGESMDLRHASSFTDPFEIIAGDYDDLKGSEIIVITAGRNQKPGQSRSELIAENYKVFKKIIPEAAENSRDSIILVVTNPVDALSYLAFKLSGKPPNQVIGSGTLLDTARLKSRISELCRIDHGSINAFVLGEHGESEFVPWSKVDIGGMPFGDYCRICDHRRSCDYKSDISKIYDEVKDSAKAIIEKKGETSYGIGLSIAEICQSILRDKNSILPFSSYIDDGYYGIEDVYLSLPRRLNKKGARQIIDIGMDEKEIESLKRSFREIRKQIDGVT